MAAIKTDSKVKDKTSKKLAGSKTTGLSTQARVPSVVIRSHYIVVVVESADCFHVED